MGQPSQIHVPSVLLKELTREQALRLIALKWSIDRGAESYGKTRPLKKVMEEAEGFLEFMQEGG